VGETLIVFERDHAARDVEGEVAVGAVVVFPAAMELPEEIIGELLDRFPDRQACPLHSRAVRRRGGDVDCAIWKLDCRAGGSRFDLLDLAGIAIAVEMDSDSRDPGLRQ